MRVLGALAQFKFCRGDRQQRLAIAFEFFRANAGDPAQIVKAARRVGGDRFERAVVKHHVGGNVVLARGRRAPRAQRVEQRPRRGIGEAAHERGLLAAALARFGRLFA